MLQGNQFYLIHIKYLFTQKNPRANNYCLFLLMYNCFLFKFSNLNRPSLADIIRMKPSKPWKNIRVRLRNVHR